MSKEKFASAYQLDVEGGSFKEIENNYRQAIENESSNKLYRYHLIRFLISSAQYAQAKKNGMN